ncbi:hypothetical protein SRB17_43450 [Streptomyces sp. RB17]|nr:hypothetical protein [Streptomyces sp. RB17]
MAKWLVEPYGWRSAFRVCVLPLLFVPVLGKVMPESLSCLVAKDRTAEARGVAGRCEAEPPAAAAPKVPAGGAPCWACSVAASGCSPRCTDWPRFRPELRGACLTFLVVFLTGVFLNSAQTTIYATVSIRSAPAGRATDVGWTSGVGRFGAVFGPWLGGQLLAAGNGDRGFTAFALAGVPSMVFIGVAALCSSRRPEHSGAGQQLVTAGRPPPRTVPHPARGSAPHASHACHPCAPGSTSRPVQASCPATSAHASTPRGEDTESIGLLSPVESSAG